MAHRDKSQSREFSVGIGWKADIGRQAVSAEPVAIDPEQTFDSGSSSEKTNLSVCFKASG